MDESSLEQPLDNIAPPSGSPNDGEGVGGGDVKVDGGGGDEGEGENESVAVSEKELKKQKRRDKRREERQKRRLEHEELASSASAGTGAADERGEPVGGEAAELAARPSKKQKKQKKQKGAASTEEAVPVETAEETDLFAALAADYEGSKAAEHAQPPAAVSRTTLGSQQAANTTGTGTVTGPDPASGSEGGAAAKVDMSAWADLGVDERLLSRLAALGYASPRPIQRECLPAAMHGRRDVCGAAETGSGKTLAYGLPILQRLLTLDDAGTVLDGLFALIICPTRELATQVSTHLRAVAPRCIRIVSLLGGLSIDKQRRQLRSKPQVVVGTPGRLWELMSDHLVEHLRSMEHLRFFVLDEVDRMVEAGHFKELENILLRLEQTNANLTDGAPAPNSASAEGRKGDEDGGDDDSSIEMLDDDDGEGEGVDADGSAAPASAPSRASGVSGAKADVDGVRQTFLFSATLMLPPALQEKNAKRLQKHKR